MGELNLLRKCEISEKSDEDLILVHPVVHVQILATEETLSSHDAILCWFGDKFA
jgi:hypothetical protein